MMAMTKKKQAKKKRTPAAPSATQRELQQLRQENTTLKRQVADLLCDKQVLQTLLGDPD